MLSDERLNRLEERLAWLERHVLEQDKAMLEMSDAAARLRKELLVIQGRLASASSGGEGDAPLDERPPHY